MFGYVRMTASLSVLFTLNDSFFRHKGITEWFLFYILLKWGKQRGFIHEHWLGVNYAKRTIMIHLCHCYYT